jgi:predicted Rossmann fold nucleotide-binding protein DprA/Smf involved in DNA uptake
MTRGAARRDRSETMRDEMLLKEKVVSLLRDGPKTIPEIAAAVGAPEPDVVLWVMALRRYGAVEELPKPKSEDYYRYRAREAEE